MSTTKRVALNSVYNIIGNNITKILTFILTILIARHLDVEGFGSLSFALSFASLFIILSDWGIRVYIQREMARKTESMNRFVSNALLLKIFLASLTLIIIYASISLLGYPASTVSGVMIAGVIIILESFSFIFDSSFNAKETMQVNAYIKIIRVTSRFLVTVPLLILGYDWQVILLAYLVAHIIGLFSSIRFYHKRVGPIKFSPDWPFIGELFKKSLPFGIATIFIIIYFKIDITMLSKMQGEYAVGLYNAAYSLVDSLHFIPIALTTALSPVAARYFITNKKKLASLYENAFRYIIILTIPTAIGTTILAKDIILLIYGEAFAGSIIALQVLIWVTIFTFTTYVLGLIMVSINKEKIGMYTTMATATLNVILNLILIPTLSYIGAAMTTVISEAFLFLIDYIIISRLVKAINLARIMTKPIIAGLVMGAILLLIHLHVIVMIAIGAAVYLSMLYLLKEFTLEDLAQVKNIMRKER